MIEHRLIVVCNLVVLFLLLTSLVQINSAEVLKQITSAHIAQNAGDELNAFFRCLKNRKIAIISAHRGGSYSGFPENALESLQRIVEFGPLMAEVDVMSSADGVLFLHHDSKLERTTTGKGKVVETAWADLAVLNLRDKTGQVTSFNPARLADVLDWSRENLLLQLDVKPPTQILKVAELVAEKQAMARVIFIVYSLADASLLSRHYPHAIFSVGVDDDNKLGKIIETNLDLNNLQALVGAAHLKRDYSSLLNTGAIVVAGTYGSEQSIDVISPGVDETQLKQLLRQTMAMGIQVMVSNEPVSLLESLSGDEAYMDSLAECVQ